MPTLRIESSAWRRLLLLVKWLTIPAVLMAVPGSVAERDAAWNGRPASGAYRIVPPERLPGLAPRRHARRPRPVSQVLRPRVAHRDASNTHSQPPDRGRDQTPSLLARWWSSPQPIRAAEGPDLR